MARGKRLFVGQKVRELRREARLDQAGMARLLGISISYLSQLENDDRPLTATVKASLAKAFPIDWASFDDAEEEQLLGALNWALADPGHNTPPPDPERIERLHLQYPEFAARYVDLHHRYRQAQERLAMMEEAIAGEVAQAARMPWEIVRDWFHNAGNYLHELDCAAEELAETLDLRGTDAAASITRALRERHGYETNVRELAGGMMRTYDADRHLLTLSAAQPSPSRTFHLANQLMRLELGGQMEALAASAGFSDPIIGRLLMLGLANYAAGALLMPYARFRAAARELRHDIDPLARQFGVSFEQACHRLSTLQRPGLRGIPVFFCRVDMAGNITKRHSATRLQFARFGGACPLWVVHEAVAVPDRIMVQLAETPDGMRYVSMARGLVKPSGSYARSPRRYAVALGCEVEHAANFIYADGLRLNDEAASTPIGISCRVCPRESCDQRAFPPLDRPIRIDPDRRQIVPYGIG